MFAKESTYFNLTERQVVGLLKAFTGVGNLPKFLEGQRVATGGRRVMDFNQNEFTMSVVRSENMDNVGHEIGEFSLQLCSGVTIVGWRLSSYTGFSVKMSWYSDKAALDALFKEAA